MNRDSIVSKIKMYTPSIFSLVENHIKTEQGIEEREIILAGVFYECFMRALGIQEDENSRDTSYRVAKMFLEEKCSSLKKEPPEFTVFENNQYDEYIVVKDIPYYSVCSHHHVTFFGKVNICYFPNGKVLGLSKFARVVSFFAQKPQTQEQLTTEIIDFIQNKLHPKGIMIKVTGRHFCMESRGAKAIGSETITQQLKGDIDKNEAMKLL